MNVVRLGGGGLVEVQGTGEHGTFSRAQLTGTARPRRGRHRSPGEAPARGPGRSLAVRVGQSDRVIAAHVLQRLTPGWPTAEENGDWLPARKTALEPGELDTGRVPVPVFRVRYGREPL